MTRCHICSRVLPSSGLTFLAPNCGRVTCKVGDPITFEGNRYEGFLVKTSLPLLCVPLPRSSTVSLRGTLSERKGRIKILANEGKRLLKTLPPLNEELTALISAGHIPLSQDDERKTISLDGYETVELLVHMSSLYGKCDSGEVTLSMSFYPIDVKSV